MLQYKLETLEGLEEQLHSLYEEKDGAYFLKVDGVVPKYHADKILGEKAELKTRLDSIEQARLEAEAERQRIEEQARIDSLKKNGDIESLEKSWAERLQAREAELLQQIQEKNEALYKETVEVKALNIAGAIKESARPLAMGYIKSRLRLGDDGIVRVVDEQGNLTASTIDEFKESLKTNPMFQDIVIVNTNSGGGAAGSGFGGGAAKKPNEYSVQEMKELRASNPELYNQLFPLK